MKITPVILTVLSILVSAQSVAAQDTIPTAITLNNTTGDQPYSTQVGTDTEHVELATGNLIVTIPFLNVPGRHLNFNYGLRYDAAFWLPTQFGNAMRWNPEQRPWLTADVIGWASTQPYTTQTTGTMFCVSSNAIQQGGGAQSDPIVPSGSRSDNPIFTDPGGVKHVMQVNFQSNAPCDNGNYIIQNTEGPDSDESGYWSASGILDPSGIVHNLSGTSGGQNINQNLEFFNMAQLADRHGNTVNNYPSGTDTIGRTPLSMSQPTANQIVYSWSDSSGSPVQYKVNLVDLAIHTDLASTEGFINGYQPFINTRKVPQTIETPAGTYHFSYNSDAEITQLITPSGVEVDYVWGYGNAGCPGSGSPTEIRSVLSRTVHNGSSIATWTFTYCRNPYTKVIFPPNQSGVQAETDYTYVGSRLTKVQQLAASGGSVLRTYDMTYKTSPATGELSHLGSITITLDDGTISRREFDYDLFLYLHNASDCSGQQGEITCENIINNVGSAAPLEQMSYTTESRGNVTAIREYAWGMGAPGPLVRQTIRTYLADDNPHYFQDVTTIAGGIFSPTYTFQSRNIVNRVSSETVYDGSSVCSGERSADLSQNVIVMPPSCAATKLAQTTLIYDNGNPVTYGYYGETTAASKWVKAPGGPDYWVTTRYTYDSYGNLISVTDPKNSSPLTVSYADSWSGASTLGCMPPQAGYVYPTVITNSLGQQTHLSYFPCTGLKASMLGPNDIAVGTAGTRYQYEGLGRPIDVWLPDGGHTHTGYDDINLAETTTVTLDAQRFVVKKTVMDGLGKPTQVQSLSDPQGTVFVDTTYDGLGRVSMTTSPYRTGDAVASTQFTYDTLGRKVHQTNADNTVASWSYAGPTIIATDENGNSWSRTSDVFGNLTQVIEPGSLTTTYKYDSLGNLKCVDQWGAGVVGTLCLSSKMRTFSYDSLSRLISSQNPETGPIAYAYRDVNGFCAGDMTLPCSKTDNRGVSTVYTYDSLNRLLSKSYTNDPSLSLFSCYEYGTATSGSAGSNLIGRLLNSWTQKTACQASPLATAVTRNSFLAYDPMGRVKQSLQCVRSNCTSGAQFSMAQNYDLAGNLTQWTDGLNRTQFTQNYDGAGRLQSLISLWVDASHPATLLSVQGYSPAGGLLNWMLGPNLNLTRTYDSRLRVSSQTVTKP